MARRRVKLSDQIRRAVDAAGVSRYVICKATGIDKALMSRFMASTGGLSVASLDALADVLGLDIAATGSQRKLESRPPGRPRKAP
jgi:transcriptional regulator with XRE-family HTH domain